MARQRLINCDFLLNEFSGMGNKAKLVYYTLIINADDLGFVGIANRLVEDLDKADNNVSLDLLENTYNVALQDLVDKGFLYVFKNNYGNSIYLIRHWFIHNKWIRGLTTNYKRFLKQVELVDGKWVMKTIIKESNINQNNTKQNKTNNTDNHWNELFEEKPVEQETISEDDDESWKNDIPY